MASIQKFLFLLACSCNAFVLQAQTQTELSVRVQVNRTPQGSYPTKLYQFQHMPGLVTVTITNRTQSPYSIYLNGTVTGDNGVRVATSGNYIPASIDIKPFEVKILDAMQVGSLFDPNSLVYTSGNTSIKGSLLGEQGLPEGTYQVCIRAFNKANRQPLSDEEPMGCSNIFTITTLEPPMILSPFDESVILPAPVQNIPLRWTTPPGAPPSTEYRIRIVELFNNKPANDAIFSTPNPFFETTVRGAPLLLYSIQHPQLQEGRSYAMMVTATDPNGASFRNNGRSEVIQFLYGKKMETPTPGDQTAGAPAPATEYATHSVQGRLRWAFRNSEQTVHRVYSGSGLVQAGMKPVKIAMPVEQQSKSFALQTAITPLISNNVLLALNTDNTLNKTATIAQFSATAYMPPGKVTAPAPAPPSPPSNSLAASHSYFRESVYEVTSADTAKERFPLVNMKLTLSTEAVPANNQAAELLATGETDGDGKFILHFLHPAYSASSNNGYLTLSIQSNDFENCSFRVPLSVLKEEETVDLGQYLLLARTYRFVAKVNFEEGAEEALTGQYGIHVYREAAALRERPWLQQEGQAGAGMKTVMVDGKEMIELYADSISKGGLSKSGNTGTRSILEFSGPGRLFYGGNLIVKLIPAGSGYSNLSSSVTVMNTTVPIGKVLQAMATYQLNLKPARVMGKVNIVVDGKSVPVEGVSVRVVYLKSDIIPGNTQSIKTVAGVAAAANSTVISKYIGSLNGAGSGNAGSSKLSQTAYAVGGFATAPAVMLQQLGPVQTKAQLVTNVILPAPAPAKICDGCEAITATTDELGSYLIQLPDLKKDAKIQIDVVSVPYEYRTFQIRSGQEVTQMPLDRTISKGETEEASFNIVTDVAEVVARIVDEKGGSLPGTHLYFKGNNLVDAGNDGIVTFRIYPGKHTLRLEKEGYVPKNITIDIPQVTGNNREEKEFKSRWATLTLAEKQSASVQKLSESPTIKASIARGNALSAAMFGVAAPTNASTPISPALQLSSSVAAALKLPFDKSSGWAEPSMFTIDLRDIGFLSPITGKVQFRIRDEATGQPLPGVRISLFDTTNTTNTNGEWYYEGYGGNATITFIPPSGYVAEQRNITLQENGQVQLIEISLKKGVLVHGIVRSGSTLLEDATVFPDDKEFLSVNTDAQGRYSFFLSTGEHLISARKSNYVGTDSTRAITASGLTQDFNLKGGGRNNYAKLLGFDIELSAADALPDGKEKWTGKLIKLHSLNKEVLSTADDLKIPFSDLVVSFDPAGNAIPMANIRTDITHISLKLFGFMPAQLSSGDVITITRAADGKGQIMGTIRADFAAVQGYRNWSIADASSLLLARTGSNSAGSVLLFNASSQTATIDNRYTLVSGSSSRAVGKLYGFNIAIDNGAEIDKDGIEFRGSVATPAVGPIRSVSLRIDRFYLNRALAIGGIEVQSTDLPQLEIAGWKVKPGSLLFSEDGFKLGGELSVTLPASGSSNISFSDLCIAKDGIYGGKFTIPDAGINLLNVANLNTDGVPLSFSRVGNSNVYRIGGKASLKINVSIMEKSFKVPLFEVMTNGDFIVQVPANYSTRLGPFGFNVTNIHINTTDNSPFIGVQGSFRADLDFLKFDVADIKVRAGAGGPIYSIGRLGVKLDVPVVKTEAVVSFMENGFEGDGSLSIPGTIIKASMGFRYFKSGSAIDLGAKFFANLPPVPIGGIVTLEGIGGGFSYKSGTPNNGFTVSVSGKLGFAGTGSLVALNPLTLTVSSAGILTGTANVQLASYLNVAQAETVFNGPESSFSIKVAADMSPLEGLISQRLQGALVISAKPGDEFVFLGCAIDVKMLGLINNSGRLGIGVALRNPTTRGGLVGSFFDRAPVEYMSERFSGVYIDVMSQLGIPREHPIGFNLFVASAKIWASSAFQAGLLLNFEENAYRLKFGGKFDAGAEVEVLTLKAGISAGLCYVVEGGRSPSLGWNFNATATGDFSMELGVGDCDIGCNKVEVDIIPPWDACGKVRICGYAKINFGYSQANGLHFNVQASDSGAPCF